LVYLGSVLVLFSALAGSTVGEVWYRTITMAN